MKELEAAKNIILKSDDYKVLLKELKKEEIRLKKTDLDNISYAQFVGLNLRLDRLVSVVIDSNLSSSDNFGKWKSDWNKTFFS